VKRRSHLADPPADMEKFKRTESVYNPKRMDSQNDRLWNGEGPARDRVAELGPGDCIVVPRGVEHRTGADEEAQVLCFEPAGVVNTGNVVDAIYTAPSGIAI